MDAFYASIEQRDRPELKGRPVIVGGAPKERGVVATCSYEARKFGIHSAMASSKAYKLCPHAVFLRPRFDVYKSVAVDIRKIFREYTDLVEPLSLDEAFLDVTDNKFQIPYATIIAEQILKKIYHRTGHLTASAGVSFNKFLAKVASDFKKPGGITIVTPENSDAFISNLPIRKFFGIGKVTEKKMHSLGIRTGSDLKKIDKNMLINTFGKAGHYFYDIAHGYDNRPVKANRIQKSIGKETTLKEDIIDKKQIIETLDNLAAAIEILLKKNKKKGQTITLKVKYYDFQTITRSLTIKDLITDSRIIMKYVLLLLKNTLAGKKKVRLLGITISNFLDNSSKTPKYAQLPLPFPVAACPTLIETGDDLK